MAVPKLFTEVHGSKFVCVVFLFNFAVSYFLWGGGGGSDKIDLVLLSIKYPKDLQWNSTSPVECVHGFRFQFFNDRFCDRGIEFNYQGSLVWQWQRPLQICGPFSSQLFRIIQKSLNIFSSEQGKSTCTQKKIYLINLLSSTLRNNFPQKMQMHTSRTHIVF